ncbi:helix-turn-helix domain-containing protein [Methylobacterium sp. J-048]|uniref:helix-turn-helix domain-containing protein n=1 Tax=Methylobacterium sp. J-048 TaxID=2836635 RepID=UPI001FBBB859|nr:helix-turn-helix domain-containing protein [Methylobacterium sp. J-048]MCJ2056087.1 helix-turn-helix domain-containing protein [Methylobacterium sp. J-048]
MNFHKVQAPQGDLRASTGKLLHRVPDACNMLAIGKTLLYRLIADGKLTAVKVGDGTRITDESIRAFAASLVQEAA